jgi:hypothetical protein
MAYTPHNKRAPKPEKPQHDWYEKAAVWTAIVGVIVVSISVGVLVWQAVIFTGQQRAMSEQSRILASQQQIMSGQLAVMQGQIRPWVSVSVAPIFPIEFGPDNSLSMNIMVTAKNVGQAAASGVMVLSEPVAIAAQDAEGIRRKQGQLCSSVKTEAFRTPANFGFSLFPGDERSESTNVRIEGDNLQNTAARTSGGRITIPLMIIGCADYQLYLSRDHHQTWFA